MADEKVIYEQGNIKITNLRAVFGEKTYSMSNITSVEKSKVEQTGCAIPGLIIAGILLFMYSFADGINWMLLVVGLVMVGGGIYASRSEKPDYLVQFGSASGEIKAYKSKDQDEIKAIVEAINTAIIQKG